MQLLLAGLVVAAGLFGAIQAGMNATLGRSVGRLPAGIASLSISVIILGLLGLAVGQLMPDTERVADTPWWGWVGGLIGALIVAAQLFAAEQLGSALFAGLFVTATLATSVMLDHYGLVGFKQHPASWLRIGGIGLMIAGVAVVSRT